MEGEELVPEGDDSFLPGDDDVEPVRNCWFAEGIDGDGCLT